MKNTYLQITAVIRAALCDMPLPEEIADNAEAMFIFAEKQYITPLMFYGLKHCPGFRESPVYPKFFEAAYRYTLLEKKQLDTAGEALVIAEHIGADILPMKGLNIKALYPKSEMRIMSDCDFLIRAEDYPELKSALLNNGFECKKEAAGWEYEWQKGEVALEFHTSLVMPSARFAGSYYSDSWRLVHKDEDGNCRMTSEDEFIFNFCHFAKHFSGGGVGIRYIADLYLFLKAYPAMNEAYIHDEFEKLGICGFYKHIRALLYMVFENGQGDEVSDALCEKLFTSDVFGTAESTLRTRAKRENIKHPRLHRFRKKFFPVGHECDMREQYPTADKYRVLLPAAWICRWFRILLRGGDELKVFKAEIDSLAPSAFAEHENELEFFGLNTDIIYGDDADEDK